MSDSADLSALYLDCALRTSPRESNTEALMQVSTAILEKNGVACEIVRPADLDLAQGVKPDTTEHGFERDDGSMGLLYALQHLGFVIPPQADAGWIGGIPRYGTSIEDWQAGERFDRPHPEIFEV